MEISTEVIAFTTQLHCPTEQAAQTNYVRKVRDS
jgi:hypothetical protein